MKTKLNIRMLKFILLFFLLSGCGLNNRVPTDVNQQTNNNPSIVPSRVATIYSLSLKDGNGHTSSSILPYSSQINITMPAGSDITNLTASLQMAAGDKVMIDDTGVDPTLIASNYSNQVTYVVTAPDGITTSTYFVNVVVTNPNTDTTISNFSLHDANGHVSSLIFSPSSQINVTMPAGSDIKNLTASFQVAAGVTVKVGSTGLDPSLTANDYSNQVTYFVTSADKTTTANYNINVGQGNGLTLSLPSSVAATTCFTGNIQLQGGQTSSDVGVNLTQNGGAGVLFYTDKNCSSTPITSVVLPANSSQVKFYGKATNSFSSATATVTATSTDGSMTASQTINITPAPTMLSLSFPTARDPGGTLTTSPTIANNVCAVIKVFLNKPAVTNVNVNVNVVTSGSGASIYSDNTCTKAITNLTIKANSSEAYFYVGDHKAPETFNLSATADGLQTSMELPIATIPVLNFGGMFGPPEAGDDGYSNYPGPDGSYDCPAGASTKLKIAGHSGEDHSIYLCYGNPKKDTGFEKSPYDFGGMFGSQSDTYGANPNPITNDYSCPLNYTPLQVHGLPGKQTIAYYCYRKHVISNCLKEDASGKCTFPANLKDYSYFGGTYGDPNGDSTNLLYYSNPLIEPANSGNYYGHSCPQGYPTTSFYAYISAQSRHYYSMACFFGYEPPPS